MIQIHELDEVEFIRESAQIVGRCLLMLSREIRPGVSTLDLDRRAEAFIRDSGGEPAFKGYPHPEGGPSFPAVLCTSVNDEIVHGIPSRGRVVKEGDILSLDFGACIDGLYGDAAVTVPVGRVDRDALRLIDVTRESLMRGIDQVRPGKRILDIAAAVQGHAEAEGFSGGPPLPPLGVAKIEEQPLYHRREVGGEAAPPLELRENPTIVLQQAQSHEGLELRSLVPGKPVAAADEGNRRRSDLELSEKLGLPALERQAFISFRSLFSLHRISAQPALP